MNTKTKITLVLVAIVAILGAIFAKNLIGYKQSTELLIKQSPFGTLSCV